MSWSHDYWEQDPRNSWGKCEELDSVLYELKQQMYTTEMRFLYAHKRGIPYSDMESFQSEKEEISKLISNLKKYADQYAQESLDCLGYIEDDINDKLK